MMSLPRFSLRNLMLLFLLATFFLALVPFITFSQLDSQKRERDLFHHNERFLLPLLVGNLDQQIHGVIEAVLLAKLLERTLVLPHFLRIKLLRNSAGKKREAGKEEGEGLEQAYGAEVGYVPFEHVFDHVAIQAVVPVIEMAHYGEMAQNSLHSLLRVMDIPQCIMQEDLLLEFGGFHVGETMVMQAPAGGGEGEGEGEEGGVSAPQKKIPPQQVVNFAGAQDENAEAPEEAEAEENAAILNEKGAGKEGKGKRKFATRSLQDTSMEDLLLLHNSGGEPFMIVSCFQGALFNSKRSVITTAPDAGMYFKKTAGSLSEGFRFAPIYQTLISSLPLPALASGQFLAIHMSSRKIGSFCGPSKLPYTDSPCFTVAQSMRTGTLECLVERAANVTSRHRDKIQAVFVTRNKRAAPNTGPGFVELLTTAVSPLPVYVMDDLETYLEALPQLQTPFAVRTMLSSLDQNVTSTASGTPFNDFSITVLEKELALHARVYLGSDDNPWSQTTLFARYSRPNLVTIITESLPCKKKLLKSIFADEIIAKQEAEEVEEDDEGKRR